MNLSSRLTRADFKPCTMVDLLLWRALRYPERRAFTFLMDGDTQELNLTYGELDRKARGIAATLQSFVSVGERALLLYPPGLDYLAAFFGCLYAGVIAVPAYPPDPSRLDRTLPRLQSMLSDAQAAVVLTTAPIMALAEFLFKQAPDLGALQWMATDMLASGVEYCWQEPAIRGSDLAFLQYTSGSTRQPRGVEVSHANLLHNSALIAQGFDVTPGSSGVIWLPPYHDMGLIGGLLQPIFSGIPCVLLSPLDFLQRPLRWLSAVSRFQATISGGPNFAFDLCLRKVTPAQRDQLDLSSWTVAFTGAEQVQVQTINRFTEYFAPCGFRREAFYPCYGLAEATLIVSGGVRSEPPKTFCLDSKQLEKGQVTPAVPNGPQSREIVGCGQILGGQKALIVHPEDNTINPPGRVGEIWVSGPSIARGYWNRLEETEDVFRASPVELPGETFLRTGDLGFLQDSELYVTGRIKDIIIVDGLNHYPHDIEQTVEGCHPAIRPGCSAAFSINGDGKELVVVTTEAVFTVKPGGTGDPSDLSRERTEVIREIRKAVAAKHDLHLHDIILLKPRSIPKTSSGKIQRHACREGYLARTLEVWGD